MIELRDVKKTYHMGSVDVQALRGISLKIDEGEFVAIIGPSGSGKSTLLHILGLLDIPDTGKYLISDTDILASTHEERSAMRSSKVGFIFQQFHLLPRYNALQNVELPFLYSGGAKDTDKAKSLLEKVGLGKRTNHLPSELSGGQQQRVAIARSLVNSPSYLLADEPTGNLDSQARDQIMGILNELHQQGITILMVTHELELAEHASRIIELKDGKIVRDEKRKDPHPPKVKPEDLPQIEVPKVKKRIDWMPTRKELKKDFAESWKSIQAYRSRALLSLAGTVIGTAALITTLALGGGAQQAIDEKLTSLGTNRLTVTRDEDKIALLSAQTYKANRLKLSDVAYLKTQTHLFSEVSPVVTKSVPVIRGRESVTSSVKGVGKDYLNMHARTLAYGRSLTEADVKSRKRVVVLGSSTALQLFGDTNPIGQQVRIRNVVFQVIGVLAPKGPYGEDRDDLIALVPVRAAMYRLFYVDYVDTIEVNVKEEGLIPLAENEITRALLRLRPRVSPDTVSFKVINLAAVREARSSTTRQVSLLFSTIALVSLLVAGIGIMNLMLVSVNERTHEIGLRKALGGTKRDILMQFLLEAVIISLVGTTAGILLGIFASLLISFLASWKAVFTVVGLAGALLFGLSIGVFFGWWPARRAAELSPIEALRSD